MKLRWKISVGVAAAGVVVAGLLLRPNRSERIAAEETRRTLRQQGFKTDVADFNFSSSSEHRVREAALTNAFFNRPGMNQEYYAQEQMLRGGYPNQMTVVGTNSAIVVWRIEPTPDFRASVTWTGSYWTALRGAVSECEPGLDAACAAALSGPIRFDFNASRGHAMLLPQISRMKTLALTLGQRTMVELHDNHRAAAWTNLLATTRLVTAWDAQPVEIVQLVRFGCATIAFNTTWQALQSRNWTEDQLAELQREWAVADFIKGLPETAAFNRACAADMCQRQREEPVPTLGSMGLTWGQALRSPGSSWQSYRAYRQQLSYRNQGSFEDEKALLLYYRERELELRRVVQCATWSEMRQLPVVTNPIPFQSKYFSRVQSMLNLRQMGLAVQMHNSPGVGRSAGFLGRAAESETARRLILTALALERHRLRHGAYPKALAELDTSFLPEVPVDFMDGKPLRYHVADSHFILYSVGLDGSDNGGKMPLQGTRGLSFQDGRPFRPPQQTDLVWPRPATVTEIETRDVEEKQAELQRTEDRNQMAEAARAEEALQRARTLARLEQISKQKPPRRTDEPMLKGQPLSKVLRNPKAAGTNQLTLDEMLTLRQIATGQEPDIATFEVAVSFDTLTNVGTLRLRVDADPDGESASDGAELQECTRDANGNCRLVWNTTYDPPGKHFLQAQLYRVHLAGSPRLVVP